MKPVHYAEALFALAENKTEDELDHLLRYLRDYLTKKHLLPLYPEILKAFEKLQHKKELRIYVKTSHPLTRDERENIRKEHHIPLSALFVETVDQTLIGGKIVEYNYVRHDSSHKKALHKLYQHLTA